MCWEVSQLQMGANNNEEVKKTVKRTDVPCVLNINGNNNVVNINGNTASFGGGKPFLAFAIVFLAIAVIALAISLCCPDEFADFVRLVISMALDS